MISFEKAMVFVVSLSRIKLVHQALMLFSFWCEKKIFLQEISYLKYVKKSAQDGLHKMQSKYIAWDHNIKSKTVVFRILKYRNVRQI